MNIHIEGEDNILEDEYDTNMPNNMKNFFDELKQIGPFSK
jgi:hypothetical protein